MQTEGQKAEIQRLRATAKAWSDAADTACNQWNLLERTESWIQMTPGFQGIWKSMKEVSAELHKQADIADSYT